MKKFKHIAMAMIAVSLLTFSSCSITLPVGAGSAGIEKGSKTGTAKATSILGFCFGCDVSVNTAAKNGGIKEVATVDMKVQNILGIIIIYETMVTGNK